MAALTQEITGDGDLVKQWNDGKIIFQFT